MGRLENPIQAEIIRYLTMRKIFCWRANSIARKNHATGAWVRNRGVGYITGVADIIGVLKDGRILAIEAKHKSGEVSEAQVRFLENINKNGGLAFVAYNVDDVVRNMKGYL